MYRPLVEQKGWSGSGRKSSQNDHFKNCFIRTNQAFKLQYISTRFLNPSAKPTNEIFRYLLHFCPTRRLYHHVAALQSGTTSCLLQIACSTLGTSLKLDPKLSKFTFYRKKVGFNTKVNKGTFCYKQLCPHHGSQTIRMEYAFCTGPKAQLFVVEISTRIHKFHNVHQIYANYSHLAKTCLHNNGLHFLPKKLQIAYAYLAYWAYFNLIGFARLQKLEIECTNLALIRLILRWVAIVWKG